jgi:hypothetical protein
MQTLRHWDVSRTKNGSTETGFPCCSLKPFWAQVPYTYQLKFVGAVHGKQAKKIKIDVPRHYVVRIITDEEFIVDVRHS